MDEYICEKVVLESHVDELTGVTTETVGLGRPCERIVRCRDCKHGDPFCDSSSYAGMIDCLHFAQWDYYDDEPGVWPVEPDGFCAWGERRGER